MLDGRPRLKFVGHFCTISHKNCIFASQKEVWLPLNSVVKQIFGLFLMSNHIIGHRMKRIVVFLIISMLGAPLFADVLGEYHFEGTLGTNIPIELTLTVNGNYIVVGEIVYTKNKKPRPILVVGTVDDYDRYSVSEYQPDGKVTGLLSFKIDESPADGPILVEGKWTNPKTKKSFDINVKSAEYDGHYSQFYDYASADAVAGQYQYSSWNSTGSDECYGVAKFTMAGEHKVHFDISVTNPNMAVGASTTDRPAVLGDYTYNFFYYENLNDCGYGFSAHFYKRFVVITTTSPQPESLRCFGMGTTLEGVYIKIK